MAAALISLCVWFLFVFTFGRSTDSGASGGKWWKRCKDLTNKFFKREEDRLCKEEGKTRERTRKTGWSMGEGENVFLSVDDRAKFGGS